MHKEKTLHYGFLDTLRALAIVLVLLRHTIRPFMPDFAPDAIVDDAIWIPLKNFFINGWVGVDLFFLLSGFLITQPFLKQTQITVKKFYLKRALRIFPAYFTVLFLIIIGAFPGYTMPAENSATAIIYHVFFMQDYTGPSINTVFWSLGVEVKFYLLAPLILIPIWKFIQSQQWSKAYISILGVIILIPTLRYFIYTAHSGVEDYNEFFSLLRSPFHNCIDGLFFGVLLAVMVKQLTPYFLKKTSKNIMYAKRILIGLTFILLSLLVSHDFMEEITLYDAVFQPMVLSVLFLGITISGLFYFKSSKESCLSKWGAKLSYSTYLVHWPLIPFCLAIPFALGIGSAGQSLMAALVFSISLWGLSISLAYVIYTFIEKPFLNLKPVFRQSL
ncbi:MAG: acyltransferase [Emcibacteraceae bacterium]|nr:acyltransferase [Emcibacteraceae bacterium]